MANTNNYDCLFSKDVNGECMCKLFWMKCSDADVCPDSDEFEAYIHVMENEINNECESA